MHSLLLCYSKLNKHNAVMSYRFAWRFLIDFLVNWSRKAKLNC